MSEFNASHNRIVWCDIPVADLDRASAFYREVLAIVVERIAFGGGAFALLEHDQGNGACLVQQAGYAGNADGPLVYFNCDGRLSEAVDAVARNGGRVIEPMHSIGPHGLRAIVQDSEGNRIALHSSAATGA